MSNFFNTARGFRIGDTILIFGNGTPDIVLAGQTIPDGALYINGDNFDGYLYDEGMASWEVSSKGITEAGDLLYQNLGSGLAAQNVQDAIDEIVASIPKNNFTATADPLATDDSNFGYSVGSRWVNINTNEAFVCLDATSGGADWQASTAETASEIVYAPTLPQTATNVQDVIDDIEGRVFSLESTPVGPLNKFDATAAPTANDDGNDSSGNGIFEVGSRWVDITGDESYVCVDASTGAAIWKPSTAETASEIVYSPTLPLISTNVQAAIDELAGLGGGGVSISEHDATGSPAAPTEEGFYRVTGAGNVADLEMDVDDLFVVFNDESVYKVDKGLVTFDYTGTVDENSIPDAEAPNSAFGTEGFLDSTWTADFGVLSPVESFFENLGDITVGQDIIFLATDIDLTGVVITKANSGGPETLLSNGGDYQIVLNTAPTADQITNLTPIVAGDEIRIYLPQIQYTSTTYDWDKTSSIRVSLEQTEVVTGDFSHFVAFTTHPANLAQDFAQLFSGIPMTSNTDVIATMILGDPINQGFATGCLVRKAGDIQPSQYRTIVGSTNGIGVDHTLYVSVNGNDELFLDVEQGTSVGTGFINTVVPIGSVGNLTLVVGTISSRNASLATPTFNIDWQAGNSTGTPAAASHSAGDFGTLVNIISPDLKTGTYESAINQTIGSENLLAGDIFSVLTDGVTVKNLSKDNKALEVLNYSANVDTYPSTVSTVAPDGAVSLVDDTLTVSWNGNGDGFQPVALYTVTDLVWDKTSSKRITMEITELALGSDAPFIIFTTRPENLASDLPSIFNAPIVGGFSNGNLNPTEAFILFAVVDAGPGGTILVSQFWQEGEENASQVIQTSTNGSFGTKHSLYLSINNTLSSPNPNLLITAFTNNAEVTPVVNNQDLGSIPNLTMCLGAVVFDDSDAGVVGMKIDYIFGNLDGTPAANLHSESTFTPFPLVSVVPLKSGIYESGSAQEINGTTLGVGDVFAILTDNSTAHKLNNEEGGSVAPATHILYKPNATDALGSYGTVTETGNPYTANSFEEAVAKSKAAGRLPIVIDTNILEIAGLDATQPRIKSFNENAPSPYDLTNITVYTWDAWIRRDYATIASIDIVEDAILVDKGVVLTYMSDEIIPVFATNYYDDFALVGGNQVHGWVGFSKFLDTNEVMDDELPDTLSNVKPNSFIQIYSNRQDLMIDGTRQTFVLWGSIMDKHGAFVDPESVYNQNFIEIITKNLIGGLQTCDVTIDLQARRFSDGSMPIKITHDGRTNGTVGNGSINVLFKVKTLTDERIFANQIFEGFNTNVPFGTDNKLTLYLDIEEVPTDFEFPTPAETQLRLMFEPRDNTIIEINDVNTTKVGWDDTNSRTLSAVKRGQGRLHIANVSNPLNPVNFKSQCNRNESGITWGGGTFNITHQDIINSHTLSTPTFDTVTVTGFISNERQYSNLNNDGSFLQAELITSNVAVCDVLNDSASSWRLPQDAEGKVIKVFNDDDIYSCDVYPDILFGNLGLGVGNPETLTPNTWVEYTGIDANRWIKTNSGTITI